MQAIQDDSVGVHNSGPLNFDIGLGWITDVSVWGHL